MIVPPFGMRVWLTPDVTDMRRDTIYDFDTNPSLRTYTHANHYRWSAAHPFCRCEQSEANS